MQSGQSLTVFKWATAGVVSLWVSIPVAVQTLIVMMMLDYATGVLSAVVKGNLSAAEGRKGLARKILTLILVVTAHFVVKPLLLPFDFGATVAIAMIANELISITENCHKAGVPLPAPLIAVLAGAKKMAGRDDAEKAAAAAIAGDAGSRGTSGSAQ